MTDFRSVEHLNVFRDGIHVADLHRRSKGCEFRYVGRFFDSAEPPIARHLTKSPDGIRTEGVANLPTFFAGLLPEGIMFSAVRSLIGSAADDLFAILAATGADAVGDVEVRVPGEPERTPTLNLAEASRLIHTLLERPGHFPDDRLAAIPGVQPKLSLGDLVRSTRRTRFIAKFESPDFPGLLENEFTFMRLARKCGMNVAEVQLTPNALVVSRFDRVFNPESQRIDKVHVEDLLQIMDLFPHSKYSLEYRDLMVAMEDLGVSKATLLEALRLYVFSYIVGNGDLHAKNVSLIFDRVDRQWRLAPAYDLLSTLPYPHVLAGADRMALALADETFGRFSSADFIAFGESFALPAKAVEGMIRRTARAVVKHFPLVRASDFPPEAAQVIEDRASSLAA